MCVCVCVVCVCVCVCVCEGCRYHQHLDLEVMAAFHRMVTVILVQTSIKKLRFTDGSAKLSRLQMFHVIICRGELSYKADELQHRRIRLSFIPSFSFLGGT